MGTLLAAAFRHIPTANCQPTYLIKRGKTSAVSTTDGWLKLNLASCVTRQTRSLGKLVLYSNCNMVFVNYIYAMDVGTHFHKFCGMQFARVLLCIFITQGLCGPYPFRARILHNPLKKEG